MSSGFLGVTVEWDIVNKHETLSLMLGFGAIKILETLVGAVT